MQDLIKNELSGTFRHANYTHKSSILNTHSIIHKSTLSCLQL